jgi:hypothetical protein
MFNQCFHELVSRDHMIFGGMGTAILVQPTRFSLKPGTGPLSGPKFRKVS